MLIAAGMDTRAFRLDWPDGIELYEVDHALLIAEKRRRLDALGAEPRVDRREVSADLTQEWLPDLEAAGFDRDRPTLWVAEALTFFLTEEQAAGLLRLLASASAPGSHLAFDILGRACCAARSRSASWTPSPPTARRGSSAPTSPRSSSPRTAGRPPTCASRASPAPARAAGRTTSSRGTAAAPTGSG